LRTAEFRKGGVRVAQDISWWVAFGGGLAAFLSPCILPMVPTYLFFLAGEGIRDRETGASVRADRRSRWDLIMKAGLFVVGFTGVFVLFGVLVGALGTFFLQWRRVIMNVAGAVVILFGVIILVQITVERNAALLSKIPFLYKLFSSSGRAVRQCYRGTYVGAFITGGAFSLAWGPCAGPIAGSIAAYASVWGDVLRAVWLSIAFSAGLGIPFLMAAVFVDRLTAAIKKLSWLILPVRVVSAVLLIVLGVIVYTDSLWRIGTAFV